MWNISTNKTLSGVVAPACLRCVVAAGDDDASLSVTRHAVHPDLSALSLRDPRHSPDAMLSLALVLRASLCLCRYSTLTQLSAHIESSVPMLQPSNAASILDPQILSSGM